MVWAGALRSAAFARKKHTSKAAVRQRVERAFG